jgi:hypothetical protein
MSAAGTASLIVALGLSAGVAHGAQAQSTQKGTVMTQHATGDFDVKVAPVPLNGPAEDPTLGRMTLEKHFHGDLEALGKGQMLTAANGNESRAYVAIERVTGTLQGRSGSFFLQHWGTMTPGEQHLEVKVVPGSGTDGLAGLAGTLNIIIADGKHSYDFAYSLPATP